MSIWDEEWDDYEFDRYDFEVWLDSLEGEGTDKDKYDKWIDEQAEAAQGLECPVWVIQTPKFDFRICLN